MCVGSNASPSKPTFSGQESLGGEIIYTSDIDGFESFGGQRVVCLGIGKSGLDVPYWIDNERAWTFCDYRSEGFRFVHPKKTSS